MTRASARPAAPLPRRSARFRPRPASSSASSSSSRTPRTPALARVPPPTKAHLGDGWRASHVELFADRPETRALVTCDLLTLRACDLVPELPMWLVDGEDILELWRRVEAFASEAEASAGVDDPDDAGGLHPPYWAVPWVGGQGVARYILDDPDVVRGKRVLDVGSGCGVAALAAARAGAVSVTANDVDPLAAVAFRANADACGLAGGEESTSTGASASASASASRDACVLETSVEDLLKSPPESVRGRFDVVMAGDVCFQKGLADAFRGWLARVAADADAEGSGVVTLLGDPGRQIRWAPSAGWARGVREAAAYEATTGETHALTEGEATRRTVVWRAG